MAYQVIYSSQAAAPMSMSDLAKILVDARSGNERRGITGALIYVEGVFLQILEGPKDTVQSLMSSIAKDSRHVSLQVFYEAEVNQPMFSTWKMAYLNPTPGQIAAWVGLEGTASVEEILADVHRTPNRASRVADGILKALAE
jgi:Sensors of blue-light using FAD